MADTDKKELETIVKVNYKDDSKSKLSLTELAEYSNRKPIYFQSSISRYVKAGGDLAQEILQRRVWNGSAYQYPVQLLKKLFPKVDYSGVQTTASEGYSLKQIAESHNIGYYALMQRLYLILKKGGEAADQILNGRIKNGKSYLYLDSAVKSLLEKPYKSRKTKSVESLDAQVEQSSEPVKRLEAPVDRKALEPIDPKYYCDTRQYNEELVAIAQTGNIAARDLLIETNKGLAYHVAKKYVSWANSRGLELSDLINIGLMAMNEHAIPKYDSSKGTKFATYAQTWIRSLILREIRNSLMIHVPLYEQSRIERANRADSSLEQKMDDSSEEDADIKEIMPKEELECRNHLLSNPASLDGGSAKVYEDTLVGDSSNPEEVIDKMDGGLLSEKISKALDALTERQREIIKHRFGFYDGVSKTLAEIGELYHVSREAIRLQEKRALKKLKKSLPGDILKFSRIQD